MSPRMHELRHHPTRPAAALVVSGIKKSFAGVTVLHDVALTVEPGTVHCLLGHNGSGKSTLIKILAGYHSPDHHAEGRIFDHDFTVGDSAAASRAGLRFVHQDLGLVDELSTVDNMALGVGYPERAGRTIRWRDAARRSRTALTDLGYDIDVHAPVGSLSASERTGVAIARALQAWTGTPRVVVLDEPTASMPAPEVERLFAAIGRLREQGLGILYVTHHLDEVLELADHVTILRNGHVAMSRTATGLDHDDLVTAIIGRQLDPQTAVATDQSATATDREPVLQVQNLSTRHVHDLSFTVARGEIVGIAGIAGSGREEILPALAGVAKRQGEVTVAGTRVRPGKPRDSIRAGIGLVPADRRRSAVVAGFDVTGNLTVSDVRRYTALGWLRRNDELADARQWLDDLEVTAPGIDAPILTLSGGNQQKVMVGRWLRCDPAVIALDEPTQGVDIGARHTIYRALTGAAANGRGVLVSSADADELASVCDRVLVLAHGRVVAEVQGEALDGHHLDVLSLHDGRASQ